ncbi:MAG: PLDc N-terminal domain-containing protein [Candidatus Omnitrophota bacterium]|nr:MAG: PLDc N-terminal domain-containing protein [Candidatus Omnitrophota bacterium]
MEFLIGIVILILDIVAVADAIRGSLSAEKKILWVALIIFLPVLGLILYYLLGRPGK